MSLHVKRKINSILVTLFRGILLFGICYVILVPLLNRFSTAMMPIEELYDQSVRWIPRNPTWDNFKLVWKHMDYVRAFSNTFMLSMFTSVLQVGICTMVAYGLARCEFPGSNIVFALAIFTLIVPPQIIMTPIYLNFRFFNPLGIFGEKPLNLVGTYWPFALLSITGNGFRNGLYIFIMRQFFRGMPRELEEAAYIDGAGLLRTFFSVMLPGSIPGLVVTFLFSFVWQWNDYLYVTTFMSTRQFLPQALEGAVIKVSTALSETDPTAATSGFLSNHFSSLINNAGMILVILPLLILYIFMQRYFVEGIERTGIVG